MKSRPSFHRAAVLFAVALTLVTLSSCVKDQPQPNAPGPHQGNGAHEGKDMTLRSPGPHQ